MRKWIAVMVSLCVLLCAASAAQATGVTLRTFTPFADVDFFCGQCMRYRETG